MDRERRCPTCGGPATLRGGIHDGFAHRACCSAAVTGDTVARLQREREALRAAVRRVYECRAEDLTVGMRLWRGHQDVVAEVARLREALGGLLQATVDVAGFSGDMPAQISTTAGAMRRARAALTGEENRAMNLREIATAYLRGHGYDGLYDADGDCACDVDDLFPCGEPGMYCVAGYKQPCDCEGGGCDWHIGSQRGSRDG